MKEDEYNKLLSEFGEEDTKRLIEILNNYKGATGKRYKSDYLAIRNWVINRLQEEKRRRGVKSNAKLGQSYDELYAEKISDSDVLREYICEGCQCRVQVRPLTHLFGPMKGQPFEAHYGCKCEDIRNARETLQKHEERKRAMIFGDHSLINPNLQGVSFETYHPRNESEVAAKKTAINYTETFDPKNPRNILFVGNYGLGKSHLAASISKALMGKGYTSIFIAVPKLLTKIRDTYRSKSERTESELLEVLEKVDCLILDDVGAEQSKKQDDGESWAVSKLFEIIDSRVGKHTVFTTNLNSRELQDRIGPRSYSRMMQNTEIVKVVGEDYRLKDF